MKRNNRNNRFKLLVVLLVLTLLLCGCWDVKEINLRTPPLLIGLAKGTQDEYRVTLYAPITQKGKTETRIITDKGNSISSVLQQMQTNSDDALDYTQVQFVVIQNNLAENEVEMDKLVRLLMDIEQLPTKSLVAITDEDIEQMLSNIKKVSGTHATSIQDFFNKGQWAPEVSSTRIWELYRSLNSYTKDINIPIVASSKDTILRFEGSAIFKKEKMVGRINPRENLLVNLFHHRNATGEIESIDSAGMIVKNSSLRIKSSMKKDEPLVSCDLQLKVQSIERKEGMTDQQIQAELEKLIEKQFSKIFEQAQKNKSDIFGFGQHFRNQIPYQKLKNWRDEYYPNLKVNFQVHVSHI
ncbi:Ger(x)C family spore germination protein [Paenibacillus aestuarii]|uniref:Ger(X)C family spore germination protein n=1 Tax=Paenibacillus aestuarii TaxID=516965 RepID=A0ABW0KDH9_9BACL|nr:Ger(x)C family spore germination protein [Paenibacillus aestuarii]